MSDTHAAVAATGSEGAAQIGLCIALAPKLDAPQTKIAATVGSGLTSPRNP